MLRAAGTERIRHKVEHGCGRRSAGVVRVQLRQVDEASMIALVLSSRTQEVVVTGARAGAMRLLVRAEALAWWCRGRSGSHPNCIGHDLFRGVARGGRGLAPYDSQFYIINLKFD